MLVGAGGNAGAQAAVNIVRAIAVKKIVSRKQAFEMLCHEAVVGFLLACGLFVVGFVRVMMTRGLDATREASTIGAALFLIVLCSVTIGAALPLLFHFGLRIDSANASSSVQVVMDVMGVTITCVLANVALMQA